MSIRPRRSFSGRQGTRSELAVSLVAAAALLVVVSGVVIQDHFGGLDMGGSGGKWRGPDVDLSAKVRGCGGDCKDDGDCSDPCTYCNTTSKQCQIGLPCGAPCILDADCDNSTGSNCTYCTKNICTGSGECGAYCTTGAECVGVCESCINHECVAACNQPCVNDTDCNYPGSECHFCIDNECQVGGCGTKCSIDSDCAEQGNCTQCLDFKCYASCGGACSDADQCAGLVTGCGNCDTDTYTCGPGVCGSECSNGNGCEGGNETCSRCSNFVCVQGLACGEQCLVNTDCEQTGSCPYCVSQVCAHIPAAHENKVQIN